MSEEPPSMAPSMAPSKTQVQTERGSELTTFFRPDAVCVDAYPDGTTVIIIRHGGTDHVLTFEPEGGPLSKLEEPADVEG